MVSLTITDDLAILNHLPKSNWLVPVTVSGNLLSLVMFI